MCVVSMIMDHGLQKPREWWTRPDSVRDFEELLKRARKYDEDNNEPDCELDEKRQALKKLADELGIEIKFL